MTRPPRGAAGQATVELLLVLPVVILALLLVIQMGLIARAQILVVNAAREGARAAAVDGPAAAQAAAVQVKRVVMNAPVVMRAYFAERNYVPSTRHLLSRRNPGLRWKVVMIMAGPSVGRPRP